MTTPEFSLPDITASNIRHDQEHGPEFVPVRPAWREAQLMRRGELTDRKIAKYERMGFYSEAYRTARKALMDRKAKRRLGNFDLMDDGRMIYNLK